MQNPTVRCALSFAHATTNTSAGTTAAESHPAASAMFGPVSPGRLRCRHAFAAAQ